MQMNLLVIPLGTSAHPERMHRSLKPFPPLDAGLHYIHVAALSITASPTQCGPVTVADRSDAWTVFDCSEAVIAGLNPALGMDL
jgi:hypothetical protein